MRFKIDGNLRFLSHLETIRVFQRALVRAGIKVCYSEGFNPHPKLSLPFPRSVGVESDDEMACVLIPSSQSGPAPQPACGGALAEEIEKRLGQGLPCGCELVSVKIIKGRVAFHPVSVIYVFALEEGVLNEDLKARAGQLARSERLVVVRRIEQKGGSRMVDVAPFIESVEFDSSRMAVKCQVSPTGTVRAAEIMELLALDESMLTGAIKRTKVQWQRK